MKDTVPPERKARKSVAFADGASVFDSNGEVSEVDGHNDKSTAESHSSTNELPSHHGNTYLTLSSESSDPASTDDKEVDEVADLFKGLAKKKKSKKPKDEAAEAEAPAGDEAFDPSMLKKKKKKSSKSAKDSTAEDFEAKLAQAGIEGGDETATPAEAEIEAQEGDAEEGTGIWQHNSTTPISYDLLLSRFFTIVSNRNPNHLDAGTKSIRMAPPQCLREGNKKTIFANIEPICKRLKRSDEHLTAFLFAELGTSGSVDGSKRLVIKGRFTQRQIEAVLRKYIGMCMYHLAEEAV